MGVSGYAVAMRVAGGWEPPPAMYRAIGKWVADIYASHVLALVQDRLDGFAERAKVLRGPEIIATYRQTVERSIRALKPGKTVRFKSPVENGDFLVSYDPSPDDAESAWRPGSGKGTRIDWDRRSTMAEVLQWFESWCERQERSLAFRASPRLTKPPAPEKIVELQMLKNECGKYTDAPKKRANKVEERFPIDVRGWKYLTPAEVAAEQALDHGTQIKVIVYFRSQHDEWAGLWSADRRTILLDAPAGDHTAVPTVEIFRTRINNILGTTYHETQHLGQSLLKSIRGLKEEAGLPSRSVRIPGVNPHGTPQKVIDDRREFMKEKARWKKWPDARVPHALRDVEYHTNLQEDVRALREGLAKMPPTLRRLFFRFFVGEIQDRNVITEALSKIPGTRRTSPTDPRSGPVSWQPPSASARMWKLHDEAPEKWKLLVRELAKSVHL
jgi:hypothetical protein